ncbi:hypothetical protein FOWG_09382 [Fusarium oxysporum f. sp. lycopersici MN25]|nr:hypothetical protein FOWG_09382 [Fusarium oxysporum f. sp. lycopersici MN25]EWZ87546.1 hypothetical protein FOWG_09382 [Fusarium oxysporum f. sp. lycopersici MN25]EWZ87547.1 hypothetical protein FOWG_09382 [Fusarium oxysporum f. sp. lycopersici MN25]
MYPWGWPSPHSICADIKSQQLRERIHFERSHQSHAANQRFHHVRYRISGPTTPALPSFLATLLTRAELTTKAYSTDVTGMMLKFVPRKILWALWRDKGAPCKREP